MALDGCWNCKKCDLNLECEVIGGKVPDEYICADWRQGVLDIIPLNEG